MKFNKKQTVLYFFGFLILALFFCLYNYLNIYNSKKPIIFNSPDETVNYFFSINFVDNLNFEKHIDYLSYIPDAIPRSVKTENSSIMPIGFIGLPMIYGAIAKLLGKFIIIYLTPIFAITGAIFFYLFIKEFFSESVAIISSILLLIFPGYWYFSIKAMMPNVLLCSFLIISLYYLIKSLKNKKIIYYILCPAFLALTLSIRTSEIIWIGILFLGILIFYRKNINFKKFLLSVVVFIIFISPLLYFNNKNQGSVALPGYYETIKTQTIDNADTNFTLIKKVILPFGLHPRNILFIIKNYILNLLPIYSLLILISAIIFLFQKKKMEEQKLYFYLWILISTYLLFYYGSWIFNDNPTGDYTIGSSYIRYLLPIFIFGMPILAYMLDKIYEKNKLGKIFVAIFIFVIFFNSYNIVMTKGGESIKNVSKNIIDNQKRTNYIIKNTSENSLIFTDRADKYIFPYRNPIYLKDSISNFKNIEKFKNTNIDLYYFIPNMNIDELKNIGLESNEIIKDSQYGLYKLNFINEQR